MIYRLAVRLYFGRRNLARNKLPHGGEEGNPHSLVISFIDGDRDIAGNRPAFPANPRPFARRLILCLFRPYAFAHPDIKSKYIDPLSRRESPWLPLCYPFRSGFHR